MPGRPRGDVGAAVAAEAAGDTGAREALGVTAGAGAGAGDETGAGAGVGAGAGAGAAAADPPASFGVSLWSDLPLITK